ncbi:MAG: glyoxylate/hydroxypyruvate reductase A, partial [Pseudomonadota bacterium]
MKVLFAAREGLWDAYRDTLLAEFAKHGMDVDLAQNHPPSEVDYIIYAPHDGLSDFTPFTQCKAVFSLWAGVEQIVTNPTLTQPLAKMVNPDLTAGMVEWVTGHVMRHHLGMDSHILDQSGTWNPQVPPLARDRPITVLGLGTLGAACAQTLAHLGFPVRGWSRSSKDV